MSSYRSILGEHDLDDRVTIGMGPLIHGVIRTGGSGGGGCGTIPSHINKVTSTTAPKSLLMDSTSPASSTASLGSSLLEDWYDQTHEDESRKPAAHIEFPTPLGEHQLQGTSSHTVWMDQVAALIGVLAVCFFFYLQHQIFLEKDS